MQIDGSILAAKAAQLKAAEQAQPQQEQPAQLQKKQLLFVGTAEDKSYLSFLKILLNGHDCKLFLDEVQTLAEIRMFCLRNKIDAIITTSPSFILKLSGKKKASVDNYAGSLLHLPESGTPIVCINKLEHFVTVPYGKHLAERYISKVVSPESWFKQSELSWEIATPENLPALYERFQRDALYIACDIETKRDGLRIDVSGYCAIFADGTTHSIVIPVDDMFMLNWAGKFNSLPQAKIFQNGMYDNAYNLRWGVPVENYIWDTLHLFHCWYSEMPKSLDFLTSYLLPDFQYWKDESSGSQHDYYFYNAKDTWATANCFLALMREMPAWAKANYLIEFPLVFPSLHCSMEGIAIDTTKRDEIAAKETKKLDESLASLRASLGNQAFNPSSPKQVKQLMDILGCKDLPSSNVKELKKAAARHPLNAWFFTRITNYREARKLLSSYLDVDLLNGRFLYSLNPAGTDTGRLASKDSQFWCGSQIQNIPPEVKGMFVADEGWLLAEVDKSQSEDRCVAVLSGEPALLEIFSSGKDSHSYKGAMFFGVSYEEIKEQEAAKKRGEFEGMSLRDYAKRINHGANYNMGAGVLLETMGIEAVISAKRLLKLPTGWQLKQVCEHLLSIYNKTFPAVKGRWYDSIKLAVQSTRKLTGATGWTRFCFGNPAASKQSLNAYVAHVPQSLSVMIVNREFLAIWRWALDKPHLIRIKAQIHDSILFQYRAEHPEIVDEVNAMMQSRIDVKGSDGKVRELFIPTDVKHGHKAWGK